ncbi:EAL domain-containing protein [Thiomicrorhabdus sediminis]|nr:EAL domain-containing protein [Thiomicrorhabdus sediminis]
MIIAVLASIQLILGVIDITEQYTYVASYLSLHLAMEMVSVFISLMVFIVGWNVANHKLPSSLLLLSLIFFNVGIFDYFHAVSYGGMPDFLSHNDVQKHLNFWMAARFISAFGLLLLAIYLVSKIELHLNRTAIFIASLTFTLVFLWLVIYRIDLMPVWFVEGQGLTDLKKNLEYVIIGMNVLTALILLTQLNRPRSLHVPLLIGAVLVTAMSELYFTWYSTMTGVYNIMGHLYKVVAYFMIYRAIVVEAIDIPFNRLKESQETLDLAVTSTDTGLWRWPLGGDYVYLSPILKRQLGYNDHELANSFSALQSLLHPDDKAIFEEAIQSHKQTLGKNELFEVEVRFKHKNGDYRWIYSRGKEGRDKFGNIVEVIGTHTDVTHRRIEHERFRSALQASPNAMIMVDKQGCIVLANKKANLLFGYKDEELLTQPIEILVPNSMHEQHSSLVDGYMQNMQQREMAANRMLFAKRQNGEEFRVEVSLTPIKGSEENYVLASIVDLTEKLASQTRIEKLMHYDILTELPNRQLLVERANYVLDNARQLKLQVGLLLIGLDRFKNLNDSLGHSAGDEVLVEFARRLKSTISAKDTLARLGGDEFAILMPSTNTQQIIQLVNKVKEVLKHNFVVKSEQVLMTASMGIAMYPENGNDFSLLFQSSDTALARAKQIGIDTYLFFDNEMQLNVSRILKIDSAMHEALTQKQFYLEYQPQVDIQTKRLKGVEALIRWKHPEMGIIPPLDFIPQAESNGLILPLGEWVLETALKQLRSWLDKGFQPVVMAVNLSALQFKNEGLDKSIEALLKKYEIPPEYLELELTESMMMENPTRAITALNKLHAKGIRLAIDDFGTGYSSLSYLKQFNIHKLKIDQSFVRDIATNDDDRAIVSAIIQMAESLGYSTIAEGVETDAQLEFLQQNSCDEYQGYGFSRPVLAEVMEEKFLSAKG